MHKGDAFKHLANLSVATLFIQNALKVKAKSCEERLRELGLSTLKGRLQGR